MTIDEKDNSNSLLIISIGIGAFLLLKYNDTKSSRIPIISNDNIEIISCIPLTSIKVGDDAIFNITLRALSTNKNFVTKILVIEFGTYSKQISVTMAPSATEIKTIVFDNINYPLTVGNYNISVNII